MLGLWLQDLESLEAISQNDAARRIFLRMSALSQAGRLDFEEPPKKTKPKGAVARWSFSGDRAVLLREFSGFEKRVRSMARADGRTRLLMSTPSVGAIVALTYASAIDDPARFKSSKQAGPHFGLTPRKYQSGETDRSGRISKIGDASVREALYQAAHVMLTKPVKGCAELKSWAMRIAKRAGMRKAKVALARTLTVIMHRMLADEQAFRPTTRTKLATVAA